MFTKKERYHDIECPVCHTMRKLKTPRPDLMEKRWCQECWQKAKMTDDLGRFTRQKERTIDSRGYIYLTINAIQDSELRDLCLKTVENRSTGKRRSGRIYEHLVIMIEKLQRPLEKGEVIHHVDGDRSNNDPKNLTLITQEDHLKRHRDLLTENALLKDRVKELEAALAARQSPNS